MKEIKEHFETILCEASKIGVENLSNENSKQRISNDKNNLLLSLNKDNFIKIPFVGDFNAGKSSLLNSFIGRDLLPTNIVPETAVSYELYYDETECLELIRENNQIEKYPLTAIGDLKVKPGDVVNVYINNEKIKQLNERNIVIVDMPGIDSGIEAHNNAILNYIQEGTFFVVVNDIEQGTLRRTTLSFIDEIKKYSLSLAVILSKSDKKPAEEHNNIKSLIEQQAKASFGKEVQVEITSATTNNIEGIEKILANIDAKEFVKIKYSNAIENFVSGIIDELTIRLQLLSIDTSDFDEKIKQLEEKKQEALESLKSEETKGQNIEGSVQDILDDVRNALMQKSTTLATLVFNSKNNSQELNAELLSIIRPVLINSFKREINEYQEVISKCVMDFSMDLDNILKEKDNKVLAGVQEAVGTTMDKAVLEKLLQKGLENLAKRLVGYKSLQLLLGGLSKFLGPIVAIIINFLPDILRMIFGKGKEAKINEIKQKLESEVYGKIVESLREQVTLILSEQREETIKGMHQVIIEKAQQIDDNINQIKLEKETNKQEIEKEIATINTAIINLQNLMA